MIRKLWMFGFLASLGAVAWVQAQERPGSSILTSPRPLPTMEEPRRLSDELRQVQSQVTQDHQPAAGGAFAPVPRGPAVQPASFTARAQDDEVPAILSGRSGQRGGNAPTNTSELPVVNPRNDGTGPIPAPRTAARPIGGDSRPTAPPAGLSPTPPISPSDAPQTLNGPSSAPALPATAPMTTPPATLQEPAPAEMTAPAAVADPASIGLSIPGPMLHVDVAGASSVAINKPTGYRVTVSNRGRQAAENVLVAIDFPAAVSIASAEGSNGELEQTDGTEMARVIWTVATIAAGEAQTLDLQLTPTAAQPFELAVEWTLMPLSAKAQIEVTQPALAMTVQGPTEILFGQQATFVFEVSNTGNGAAENVEVRMPEELGGEARAIGTIPAGESRSFEIEVAPVEAGEMTLSATAVAEGGLSQEASTTFVVRRGKLDVAATGPEFEYAGTVVTYDLQISNSGDAPATDVIAAAALPAGAEYVDGVEGGEQVEGGVRWEIGTLQPGENRSYSIRCILHQAGQLEFGAGARGEGGLSGEQVVATVVEAVADLVLTVEDPKGPKPVGEEVTYTLRITNRGTEAAVGVNLVCQFSEGIEPVRTIGHKAELVPGQAIFETIERIEAGKEMVIELKAAASSEGNHTFRAELTCDQPETRRLFEGTTRFFGATRGGNAQARPATPPASAPQLNATRPATTPPTTDAAPTGGSFRPSMSQRPGAGVPR